MSGTPITKEAIQDRIKELRAEAKELLAQRVSYGEHLGRSRLTDGLLAEAEAKEQLADELEKLL